MSDLPIRYEAWKERARGVLIEDELARRGIRLNGNGKERQGPCPKCGGDDRFSINTSKKVFNCRGCGIGGDVIKLVEHLDDCDFSTACVTLTGEQPPKTNGHANGKNGKAGVVTAQFDYNDLDGVLVFAVERLDHLDTGKKTFRQKRQDPNRPGRWIYNVDGVRQVPYRLFDLTETIATGQTIFIVEGEKCADALWQVGVPATTNAGGAGKWREELNEYFKDADVVLVPDHDDAGWDHINKVGTALTGIAKRIRVLVLLDLRPKGDVVDWLAAGGTREKFDELVAGAQDWIAAGDKPEVKEPEAKAEGNEQQLLDELAKLTPIEYDRRRKPAAEELNIRSSTLDEAVEARRIESKEAAPLFGHWVNEPWPEPVDSDALLRDIVQRIRRHVVCTHDDALIIALWIMFAWVHETVATHSPILNVTSAEPESGKSTTLGLIALLAPRCVSTVEISEAALYRAIKLWQPSFAIDEFDSVLSADDKEGLRSVINSGHTRGQGVVRCIGEEKTPELFSTFCPKCIGMIGRKLPAATLSRCIFIALKRKTGEEQAERFAHQDDQGLADLRGRLLRWSLDNEEILQGAAPEMPDPLRNRRADNWRVLLAIADLANAGAEAREAAVAREAIADSRTASVRLLAAIREAFGEAEEIGSARLIEQLTEDPASDWAEWRHGKPISQKGIASLLKPYEIIAERVQPGGGARVRGYLRSRFEDAWARYL